jgi:N-acetyl sugar amidotransferase
MKYCTKCLLPNTKPYIKFDTDGVCSACRAHEHKNQAENGIDWGGRAQEFEKLIAETKSRKAPVYDALVPVSGGKDSITQVHRLLGHGLRILAVNVDYGIKTEIGKRNLACIPRMGANLFIYTPSQPSHRKLVRTGFEDFGDPDLLSHTMLHAFPLRVAARFEIPLVLLGENSALEYSGEGGEAASHKMTRAWFENYAANAGNTPKVVAGKYDIPYEELLPYDYPEEFANSDIHAVFCSHYFHWDSEENLRIAQQYGFESLPQVGEGTYRNYVGIDEKINRIHQYFKVLKFGYGRATDHACEDIRNGRLTREAAKALVRQHDLTEPSAYFVDDFVKFIGITHDRYHEVMERYREPAIWKKNTEGDWTIPGHLN